MKKILLVCLIVFCGCARQTDNSLETVKLLATDIEFSKKSVEAGAAEAFRSFLARDAVQLPANAEPVQGNENIYNRMKGSTSVMRWEPKRAEVAVSGDLGYTWGEYTVRPAGDTGAVIRSGKYLTVWRRQPDGLWKAIVDIGNSGPPPSDSAVRKP